MSSLKEDLEKCCSLIEIVYAERKIPYLPNTITDADNLEFILANIRHIIDRYATPRPVHSCDIPGCASCGNPEESTFSWDEEE